MVLLTLLFTFQVLDRGRVNDASSNIEYALNCAIWMYWTSSAKKMGQNEKDLSVISMLVSFIQYYLIPIVHIGIDFLIFMQAVWNPRCVG